MNSSDQSPQKSLQAIDAIQKTKDLMIDDQKIESKNKIDMTKLAQSFYKSQSEKHLDDYNSDITEEDTHNSISWFKKKELDKLKEELNNLKEDLLNRGEDKSQIKKIISQKINEKKHWIDDTINNNIQQIEQDYKKIETKQKIEYQLELFTQLYINQRQHINKLQVYRSEKSKDKSLDVKEDNIIYKGNLKQCAERKSEQERNAYCTYKYNYLHQLAQDMCKESYCEVCCNDNSDTFKASDNIYCTKKCNQLIKQNSGIISKKQAKIQHVQNSLISKEVIQDYQDQAKKGIEALSPDNNENWLVCKSSNTSLKLIKKFCKYLEDSSNIVGAGNIESDICQISYCDTCCIDQKLSLDSVDLSKEENCSKICYIQLHNKIDQKRKSN